MSLSPHQSKDASRLLEYLSEQHDADTLKEVTNFTSLGYRSGNQRDIKRSRLSLSQFNRQEEAANTLSAVDSHSFSLSGGFTKDFNDIYTYTTSGGFIEGINDIYELQDAPTALQEAPTALTLNEEQIKSYKGRGTGSNPASRTGLILWHEANTYSTEDITRFIATYLQISARAEQEAYDAALAASKSVEEADVLARAAGEAAIEVEFPDLASTFELELVRLAQDGRYWLKATHLWAMAEELGYKDWNSFIKALLNIGAEIGVLSTYNYTSLSDNKLKIEYQKPDTVFYIDFKFLLAKLDEHGYPIEGYDYETYRPKWDEVDNDIIVRVRTHNHTGLSSPMSIYRKTRPTIQIWILPIENDGTRQICHGPYDSVGGKNGACGSGATKLNGKNAGKDGTETFVSALKKRFCAKFYANPGSFIGSVPTEEAVFPKNDTLVIVKFNRAFTLDDFK